MPSEDCYINKTLFFELQKNFQLRRDLNIVLEWSDAFSEIKKKRNQWDTSFL